MSPTDPPAAAPPPLPPPADPRPEITRGQASYAVAMAGNAAASEAAARGGDPAAVDGLMRALAAPAPDGQAKELTLDVLLCIEERDRIFAGQETATWLDLAHSALCFSDPHAAWLALARGREAFNLAAFELAGKIPLSHLKHAEDHITRAFRALAHADGPAPAAEAAPNPPAAGATPNG